MKIVLCLNLFILSVIFSAPGANAQQVEKEDYVENIDYRLVKTENIESFSDLTQLEKVADIEVFYWYGCQSCQLVEQALLTYLGEHPTIKLRRTPLVAYPQWRQQAYIQPLIEQLPAQLDRPTVDDIYQICLQDCAVFSQYEKTVKWLFEQIELTEMPELDESLIWQAEKDYRKRADSFSISQVPTIIVREKYAVDANSAGSVTRLIEIMDYLLSRTK